MAQGCGCGCKGRKTNALQKSARGLGRARPGLSRAGLSQFETQNPWLMVGPEGVQVAGRNFTWHTVGGFVMQGALLYLLWTTIRHGPQAVEPNAQKA